MSEPAVGKKAVARARTAIENARAAGVKALLWQAHAGAEAPRDLLSAFAVLASAPRLSAGDCTALSDALKKTWSRRLADTSGGGQDWRTWDLSLLQATRWYDAGAAVCP